jgi:integrase
VQGAVAVPTANAQYRTREYLTEREVERLMKAAGNNRHGHRDATMILMAWLESIRTVSSRWEQVDLVHGRLHVHRLKNGMASVHPLTGIELRALRRSGRINSATAGGLVGAGEQGLRLAVSYRALFSANTPTTVRFSGDTNRTRSWVTA